MERIKVTTTMRRDLWEDLKLKALLSHKDMNDILESLIAAYLKKAKKGGRRP